MSELARFFDMGGYAVYVWSAYGLVLAVLVANVVGPIIRQRHLLRHLSERAAETGRSPQRGPDS